MTFDLIDILFYFLLVTYGILIIDEQQEHD